MNQKKFLFKLLSLISCMILILSTPTIVQASSAKNNTYNASNTMGTYSINEYDEVVKARTLSTKSLKNQGYTESEIKSLRSNEIEKSYLKYSKMTKQELKYLYNLNDEQINIIKSYKGQLIETYPKLRAVSATIKCVVKPLSTSNSTMKVRFSWYWTGVPTNRYIDIIGIRYNAVNSKGYEIKAAYDKSKSTSKVRYRCVRRSNSGYHEKLYWVNSTIRTTNHYDNVYTRFKLNTSLKKDGYIWDVCVPKSGIFDLTIKSVGSAKIKETGFTFAYGHSSISASPSISFPAGGSIGFSKKVSVECIKSVRVLQGRKLIED